MITALEAKLNAYRTREWFDMIDKKIKDAAVSGDMMCVVGVDEIPNGTDGILYEIAELLNELGYQTLIDIDNQNGLTLYIYWHSKRVVNYINNSNSEEEY
jgi:hypothetical protein